MTTRAVALLSGGLDSMLAIRILQEQGVDVEALNFQTIFACCKNTAAQAALQLNVPLTVIGQEDDYLDVVRAPQHGYGKGANPCVDCRIYMFHAARRIADERGIDVIVSGEVLGQRPMSQKRRDLLLIANASHLEDRLLRPLSALLLPPTKAEQTGEIDRARLHGFKGQGRKPLIELAKQFGFKNIPSPSTGCSLTELTFAPKVHDLIQIDLGNQRWDFELLNTGRHLRLDGSTKAVVGRREAENEVLASMFERADSRASLLLEPRNFRGPTVLVVGPDSTATRHFAGGLLLRYGRDYPADGARARVRGKGGVIEEFVIAADPAALAAETL
jgi:tRNA-uridine 2-sulfurtransferase